VTSLQISDALSETTSSLGLEPEASPNEVIAASLRRAGSVRCPSTPSALVATVAQALRPVMEAASQEMISLVLDSLVAAGDLVEAVEETDGRRRRVIYLGRPRFIRRRSGGFILLGVRPDDAPLVGEALAQRIESVGHLRRILDTADDVEGLLAAYGMDEISETKWMRHEPPIAAEAVVDLYQIRLRHQPSSGDIDDLRVLDPTTSTRYYRGRWRPPRSDDDGIFVARRSQSYGADLWCYVEIRHGLHTRLLDLPALSKERGCDEAWRLQAAVDALNGTPQGVLVSRTGQGNLRLGLPSPPPRWLQRRWDLLGSPKEAKPSLFAYEFGASDARDEIDFLREHMWMDYSIDTARGTPT
jgi:hypothetical protein